MYWVKSTGNRRRSVSTPVGTSRNRFPSLWVAAAVQLAGSNPGGAREAVTALMFYLVAYVFMNLGAFAIIAFLRNAMGTEEIADYAGLIRLAPVTSVAFTAILVSLIGIPPMVGFIGKFNSNQCVNHYFVQFRIVLQNTIELNIPN